MTQVADGECDQIRAFVNKDRVADPLSGRRFDLTGDVRCKQRGLG
ncbi:MAG TPA: hypothetical protein VGQ93_08390 [Lysobacter sp.]|nr:hypothetical protein [Lysobacter sp.]